MSLIEHGGLQLLHLYFFMLQIYLCLIAGLILLDGYFCLDCVAWFWLVIQRIFWCLISCSNLSGPLRCIQGKTRAFFHSLCTISSQSGSCELLEEELFVSWIALYAFFQPPKVFCDPRTNSITGANRLSLREIRAWIILHP